MPVFRKEVREINVDLKNIAFRLTILAEELAMHHKRLDYEERHEILTNIMQVRATLNKVPSAPASLSACPQKNS